MNTTFKRALAGVGAVALAGGIAVVGAQSASAVTPQSFDTLSIGWLTFYDINGVPVTGGSTSDHLGAYAVGDGGGAGTNAHLALYAPAGSDPTAWSGDPGVGDNTLFGSSVSFPGLPAGEPNVTAKISSLDETVQTYLDDNGTPSDGILEARLYTSNASANYYIAKIHVSGTTWSVVDPDGTAADATSISLGAVSATTTLADTTTSTANPAPSSASSVTLSATVTSTGTGQEAHPFGQAYLVTDDGTPALLPQADFNQSTGVISDTITGLTPGFAHSYKFQFVPLGQYLPNPATDTDLGYSVTIPVQHTATTLPTAVLTGTANTAVPGFIANVENSDTPTLHPSGTLKLQKSTDGTTWTDASSAVAADGTTGDASLTLSGLPAGPPLGTTPASYLVKAVFTPANGSFLGSESTPPVTVVISPDGTVKDSDPQNVEVDVPVGSLTISTPYTSANPLDLGTFHLATDGLTLFTNPVNFGDYAATAPGDGVGPDGTGLDTPQTAPGTGTGPAHTLSAADQLHNGVTVVDTRAASNGWTAKAQVTSPFTTGAGGTDGLNQFSGDELHFANVQPNYVPGNHYGPGAGQVPVATSDISGFAASAKGFANTQSGPGSVAIQGQMYLSGVATSLQSGEYDATVTFTIIGGVATLG